MASQHSATRKRAKGKRPKGPTFETAISPVLNAAPAGSSLQTLEDHRHRVTELETTVARYREQLTHLNSRCAVLSDLHAGFVEMFEHSPMPYVVHDTNGWIHDMNSAAVTILGLKRRASPPSLTSLFNERDLVRWLNHIRACARSRRTSEIEVTLRGKGSIRRQASLTTLAQSPGFPAKPDRFHTIVTDITRYRQAQLALTQMQRDYHRLIDMIEGIVWEAEPHTLKCHYVSRYAERLLGYSIEEWTRPGFWENRIFVDDRERVVREVSQAFTKRSELRLDYRVVAMDRRVVWLHDSISLIERSGAPRLLGVAIDVTEQRHAEEQLRHAHALLETKVVEQTIELRKTVSELEAFSYSISHDMRAPIRSMRGYAELLMGLCRDKLNAKELDFLGRIMVSADRLDLLVQDVLQYNRIARVPAQMKRIALDPLINNILHDYPVLASNETQIEVRQPLLPIRGHEVFVCQALSNLLSNAVKFVAPARIPKVRLWTEPIATEVDRTSNRETGKSWVRIWVEDNGVGIAPQDQGRIFRIFERVYSQQEYEGTGIGLAIVQKAVERMGGRVGVESSLGEGSRFWIDLPPG